MSNHNDICDRCNKPAFVPTRAVRCEWGCCFRDADGAPNDRPAHECEVCGPETHRLSLSELVAWAHARKPYLPQRYDIVDGRSVRRPSA